FSSRRRHTRSKRDWSSDVCSSDLVEAAERIGFPEARIPLAVSIVELALSPKSNTAYNALDNALADIRSGKTGTVPSHLKDTHYQGAKDLGHGIDYKYPHHYKNSWIDRKSVV